MSASSRGAHVAFAILRATPKLCSRCAAARGFTPARAYSAAATASIETSSQPPPPPPASTQTSISPPTPAPHSYRIRSGIILARPPLLTRRLTPFENAYFFYQKRLNERLAQPFITEAYFKPDTAQLMDWNVKVRERDGTVAKELGRYKPRGALAWDDELRAGDALSSPERLADALLRDGEARVSEDAEEIVEADRVPLERPLPRETEADRAGDVRRLDRKLDATLYLVVRKEEGGWEFPSCAMTTEESVHRAAKRVLDEAAGVNMNTWIVGRVPVAHHVTRHAYRDDGSLQRRGEKTFFIKGRIMAGQANLANNPHGYVDFKWLAKDELDETLAPEYYRSVKNMMADR